MKNKKRKKIGKLINSVLLAVTLSSYSLQTVQVMNVYANSQYSYGGDEDEVNCDVVDTKSTAGAATSAADAGGDWTVEGSEKYKIAKTLFDTLTKEYGLSGTSAAGWLGNVQAESDFSPSMVEAENGQNYSGRGFGLFQFTPGEKYINSEFYKKGAPLEEEVKNQIAFVFASELNNGAYRSYLPNAASWFGLSGVDSLEDILDNPDPEKAMLIFFSVYERGDVAQMHRERRTNAAKMANTLFNKDNIKADRSKWPKEDGASTATNVSSAEKKTDGEECTTDKKSGGAWGKDGTGTHNYPGMAWKIKDLPDDMKQYALDPESVGLKNKSTEGWLNPSSIWNQCTDLSASLMFKLWGLEQLAGNGDMVVSNWKAKFGDKGYSKTPKSGAVFSYGGGQYGHTGVVSHVFENGDILIVEQNLTGYSGEHGGTQNDWNYRIIDKATLATWEFYYPDGVQGATLNKDAKTMG